MCQNQFIPMVVSFIIYFKLFSSEKYITYKNKYIKPTEIFQQKSHKNLNLSAQKLNLSLQYAYNK